MHLTLNEVDVNCFKFNLELGDECLNGIGLAKIRLHIPKRAAINEGTFSAVLIAGDKKKTDLGEVRVTNRRYRSYNKLGKLRVNEYSRVSIPNVFLDTTTVKQPYILELRKNQGIHTPVEDLRGDCMVAGGAAKIFTAKLYNSVNRRNPVVQHSVKTSCYIQLAIKEFLGVGDCIGKVGEFTFLAIKPGSEFVLDIFNKTSDLLTFRKVATDLKDGVLTALVDTGKMWSLPELQRTTSDIKNEIVNKIEASINHIVNTVVTRADRTNKFTRITCDDVASIRMNRYGSLDVDVLREVVNGRDIDPVWATDLIGNNVEWCLFREAVEMYDVISPSGEMEEYVRDYITREMAHCDPNMYR